MDSGNLAGHLIALGNACREMIDRPVVGPEWLAGIADAVGLIRESLLALPDDRRTLTVTRKHLDDAIERLSASLRQAPAAPADMAGLLGSLRLTRTPSPISRERSPRNGATVRAPTCCRMRRPCAHPSGVTSAISRS